MLRTFAASLVLVWGGLGVAAAETQVIGWGDLIPSAAPIADPLTGVELSVRQDLGYISRIRTDLAQGFLVEGDPEHQKYLALLAERADQGIDIEGLFAKVADHEAEIERLGAAVEWSLDGQSVRMPGYALPLAFVEGGVREFFLVPYFGACIHVPPPPPNQMVYVTLDEEIVVGGLFQPVWVTGRMRIEQGSRTLSFVDGEDEIASSYVLENVAVEPYR